jgi:hypothetical protein
MESSRGSLRFDEFPTNMKRRNSFAGSARNTPIGFMKTQDRQSLVASLLREGWHARTPPSAFPFLPITMSKSRRAPTRCRFPNPQWKQIPHRESTTGATSPEPSSGLAPLLSVDRAVAYNPAGSGKRPARRGHLSADPRLVKGRARLAKRFHFWRRL